MKLAHLIFLVCLVTRKCEFPLSVKRTAFEAVEGQCEICGVDLDFEAAEFHHKVPLYLGGDCSLENCMVLCYSCHRGDEESFKKLHPNSPPRQAFLRGRGRVRKIAVAQARLKNNGN